MPRFEVCNLFKAAAGLSSLSICMFNHGILKFRQVMGISQLRHNSIMAVTALVNLHRLRVEPSKSIVRNRLLKQQVLGHTNIQVTSLKDARSLGRAPLTLTSSGCRLRAFLVTYYLSSDE